jgi:hypothetical protein
LCLHGYRQNKDTFASKTGAFRKGLKKYIDMRAFTSPLPIWAHHQADFIDAPYEVPSSSSSSEFADPDAEAIGSFV